MFLNMPYMDPMDILEFFSYPDRQQSDSILKFLWCFLRKTCFSLVGRQCGACEGTYFHISDYATFTTGSLESQEPGINQPTKTLHLSKLSKAISTVFLFWFFSWKVPGKETGTKCHLRIWLIIPSYIGITTSQYKDPY